MNCKFYIKYYQPLGERYGKFRGNGRIIIFEDGIELKGKRVLSFFVRTLIVVSILILTETVTALLGGKFFRFGGLAAIVAVFCIDDWFLKSQQIEIKWAQIDKYVIDEKKEIISFTFFGESILNPISLGGDSFKKLAEEFRSKIPENEYVIPKFFSLTGQPLRKIDRSE